MNLEFFGHACFGIRAGTMRLCIDPFEPGPLVDRLPLPDVFTHWIATHGHADHCAGHIIPGAARLYAPTSAGALTIERHAAAHDEFGGRLRGGMTDLLRITDTATDQVVVHCGDLGERPIGGVLKWLTQVPIDVLIVPVGGYFTLGADGALELARLVSPKAVIPCHASEHGGTFPELASADLVLRRVPHRPLPAGEVDVAAIEGWTAPGLNR